jgi:ABC-type transport system substrate-binding protein
MKSLKRALNESFNVNEGKSAILRKINDQIKQGKFVKLGRLINDYQVQIALVGKTHPYVEKGKKPITHAFLWEDKESESGPVCTALFISTNPNDKYDGEKYYGHDALDILEKCGVFGVNESLNESKQSVQDIVADFVKRIDKMESVKLKSKVSSDGNNIDIDGPSKKEQDYKDYAEMLIQDLKHAGYKHSIKRVDNNSFIMDY